MPIAGYSIPTGCSSTANATASEALYGALGRLERALLREENLRRELDLSPEEDRLALADPGFSAASPSSRLDGFVSEGVIRYVEYNAESPAGMAYNDELSAVFATLPVMKAFRKRFRGEFMPTRRRQLSAMLSAFKPVLKARTTGAPGFIPPLSPRKACTQS